MKRSTFLVTTAVSGLLAVGLGGISKPALAQKMEKCYGVAKAGNNDCQTATSSCAGTSKVDGQTDAFILLPSGTCERLVGGSTKSS